MLWGKDELVPSGQAQQNNQEHKNNESRITFSFACNIVDSY